MEKQRGEERWQEERGQVGGRATVVQIKVSTAGRLFPLFKGSYADCLNMSWRTTTAPRFHQEVWKSLRHFVLNLHFKAPQ